MPLSRTPFAPRPSVFALSTTAAACVGLLVSVGVAAGIPISAPAAASASGVVGIAPAAALVSEESVGQITTSTADAEAALAEGRRALDEASALTVEVSQADLDLGEVHPRASAAEPAVDTAGLRDAVLSLTTADVVPVLLFPELAADVSAQAQGVRVRVAEVRAALEAARARKAAEEAAAKAQREAAEAAAAQAAAEAAALAAANTPAGAKTVAQRMAADRYGWGADQFSCLVSLWQKESGWNYQAYNASSGATGIPQALPGSKMASVGSDWQTNASTQIAWGLQYIDAVYGAPCAAWGHSQSTNWY